MANQLSAIYRYICVNLLLYRPSFLPSLSKSRLFLSKDFQIPLAVLWDFKGLQGFQTQSVRLQIFSPPRPLEEPAGRGEGVVIIERHGNTVPRVSLSPKENRAVRCPTRRVVRGTEAPTRNVNGRDTPNLPISIVPRRASPQFQFGIGGSIFCRLTRAAADRPKQ